MTLGGEKLAIAWDARVEAPRAWGRDGDLRSERAIVPMYWFALDRHFDAIRLLPSRERVEPDRGGASRAP